MSDPPQLSIIGVDIMKKVTEQKPKESTKGSTTSTIHCVNTKRKYVYEILDGNIINEKVLQAE
jgi:hypothetical protein